MIQHCFIDCFRLVTADAVVIVVVFVNFLLATNEKIQVVVFILNDDVESLLTKIKNLLVLLLLTQDPDVDRKVAYRTETQVHAHRRRGKEEGEAMGERDDFPSTLRGCTVIDLNHNFFWF